MYSVWCIHSSFFRTSTFLQSYHILSNLHVRNLTFWCSCIQIYRLGNRFLTCIFIWLSWSMKILKINVAQTILLPKLLYVLRKPDCLMCLCVKAGLVLSRRHVKAHIFNQKVEVVDPRWWNNTLLKFYFCFIFEREKPPRFLSLAPSLVHTPPWWEETHTRTSMGDTMNMICRYWYDSAAQTWDFGDVKLEN